MVVDMGYIWARSYHDLDLKMKPFNPRNPLLIWNPQEEGWIKLNLDGDVSIYGASIGGVLQDSNANWLLGYSLNFGIESVFKVEVRAMLEGLLIAWDKGFRKVEAECDDALLVDLNISSGGVNSSLAEMHLLH